MRVSACSVQGVRNAVIRSAGLESELLLFWFCLHGEALEHYTRTLQ